MTETEAFSFSENQNDVRGFNSFGAITKPIVSSFISILESGNQKVTRLTPLARAERISSINEFYTGLKAPYFSAQSMMRNSVLEKRCLLEKLSSKKEKQAVQLEMEQLQEGLSWSIKKLNFLESQRVALISSL